MEGGKTLSNRAIRIRYKFFITIWVGNWRAWNEMVVREGNANPNCGIRIRYKFFITIWYIICKDLSLKKRQKVGFFV